MSSEQGNKIVLVGESGVGKTCIINRYLNDVFRQDSMSSSGASYASKTMYFENHKKNLKFDIWDTAGQESLRQLTKIFYKDCKGAILVYDITRKDSFDELKSYWYNQIKQHSAKDCVFAVAANKSDLYMSDQVDESVGREFAKEIGAVFKNTSAKQNSGIDDLFKIIGNKLIDPGFDEKEEKLNVENKTIEVKKKDCCVVF